MNILQKLIALIAKGQNPEFVAFMAHSMTYAFILSLIYHFTSVPVTTVAAIAMLALAAVKEFYFDAKYEQNPPQTEEDNLTDFMGYAAGIILFAVIYGVP